MNQNEHLQLFLSRLAGISCCPDFALEKNDSHMRYVFFPPFIEAVGGAFNIERVLNRVCFPVIEGMKMML